MKKYLLILALLFSAKASENMHIMFETDAHFVHPTCVAITSLLVNSDPKDKLNVHIITSGVSADDKARFETLKNIRNFNLDIQDYDVSKDTDLELYSSWSGWSPIIWARVHASEIFPNLNKVIHIDSDMIVKKSLKDYWKIDLTNDYIAAVPRMAWLQSKNYPYFESGFLMMNLDSFRRDNMPEKIIAQIKKGQEESKGVSSIFGEMFYTDEQAMTELCKGHIHALPLRCNVWQTEVPRKYPSGFLSQSDFTMKYEQTHPVILHYNSPNKPWKLTREEYSKRYPVYLYDEWKHYEDIYASSVL